MVGTPLRTFSALPPMEYRHLGRSELVVSAIGFGCGPVGGAFGPVGENDAIATIHYALRLGITTFDVAPRYGAGHAEEILGRALRQYRRQVTIITKCGFSWDLNDSSKPWRLDSSRAEVLDGPGGIHASLRRLGTDYIDLLLVHWPDPSTPFEETMGALVEARKQGKVRHIGVSNYRTEQILASLPHAPIIANEVGYNLFDRRWERAVFDTCRQFGIGILAYASLSYGLLSGKLTAETVFPENDNRSRGMAAGQGLFAHDNFRPNIAVVERLQEVAQRHGATVSQHAIAWVLRHPAVNSSLVGMVRPEQVEENVGALNVRLSQDDLAEIEAIMQGAAGQTDQLPEVPVATAGIPLPFRERKRG